MKKTIIILASFFIFSLLFWYSLVYGKWIWWIKDDDIEILSKNVFLNSKDLNYTIFRIKTYHNIKDYRISSNCNTDSEFLWKNSDENYFKITFLDDNCYNEFLVIKDQEDNILNNTFKLDFYSDYEMYNTFTDISSGDLDTYNSKMKLSLEKFDNNKNNVWTDIFSYMKKYRSYKELKYKSSIIDNILVKRENKYIVPVRWYEISEKHSKIPNAKRLYRDEYTDWIHHGWDVDAPFWSNVIAIDDWIVVRVVKWFVYEDLNKIVMRDVLSEDEKLKNLDLLRWNQVWLKTTKWDLVFYSHLNEIYSNIEVWEVVKAGSLLWTIWITWIPDKNYTDYHLHFAIHKNPYNKRYAWKYDFVDYMKWDWYFRDKDMAYILENQNTIFESNSSLTYEQNSDSTDYKE